MSGLALVGIAIVVLGGAYLLYGRYLVRMWGIDPKAQTPAVRHEDGQDYVPTPKAVVFAHQFSSIAGAGPVTGPIIAAMFGWLPALLWILVGGVFFGAVQDFGALYASVKNEGKSIGLIIRQYIGRTGEKLFLLFAWLFSILVIAAFADMVAGVFNGYTAQGTTSLPNGATATISLLFIGVAIAFGLFIKRRKPSQGWQAVLGVLLLVAMFAVGMACPLYAGKMTWLYVVFLYLYMASCMPMDILMQPRDYLSSFMLIGMIVGAVIGVVAASPTVHLPAFAGWEVNQKMLFPTLFVTIACGAISGFHSLVSSGTSSKQVRNEKDMLCIGYGSMMLECLLAVIALVVVGSMAKDGVLPTTTPFETFSSGVAGFLALLGIPQSVGMVFMTMCVSALALTSLDSVARIGRMSFQELFTREEQKESAPATGGLRRWLTNKHVATIVTLLAGFGLSLGGYNNIWPLFGSANQLLAALVLIALSVFLKTTGRKGFMLWGPMCLMLIVTFTALIQAVIGICNKLFITGGFVFTTDGLQLLITVLLMALACMVAFSCFRKLLQKQPQTDEKENA